MARLALGLDSSTQSLTAAVVDIDLRQCVFRKSLDYLADHRLNRSGIDRDYILPPGEPGEANQPVSLYFSSLDAIFADLAHELPDHGLDPGDVAVINTSAQQHGHVLLGRTARDEFACLRDGAACGERDLAGILGKSPALPFARIWRTSSTAPEADALREALGGKAAVIEITGSDAPLRFSAFGIMKTAREHPAEYRSTWRIHQISSLIPAVLTGNADVPLDFGNACGSSLMDYREKKWSAPVLEAISRLLPDAGTSLEDKLPPLRSGNTLVGGLAGYFVRKYGFGPHCRIGIGSGDNPQTKALVNGSLLSLGSSLVNMVATDGRTFDMKGYANAMYDPFDRPFVFGCRTNGALRWDNVRAGYGLAKEDYGPAELALEQTPAGNRGRIYLWLAEAESFPPCGVYGPARFGYDNEDFAADYAGIIESCLASVYLHSKHFTVRDDTLFAAGGPTGSREIMRRVAAIWNRKVIPVEKGGAALGAAASGAYALLLSEGKSPDPGKFASSFLQRKDPVEPRPEDVNSYHGPGGFLAMYEKIENRVLRVHSRR
ncbi:MAG: xylulose kinase [Candidatus Glassbacteria bacterium]|nr:xylulose kinase [Candidatus Glassbacteria bacterium]